MRGLREKQKEQRKEAILVAAMSLFDRHGYAATKVEQIAAAVIPPFLALARSRGQAARANFCLGVMPPRAMFGRS